jgi:cytochrome c oxidase cbb3-type subunit 2
MANKIYSTKLQDKLERSAIILLLIVMLTVSVGGLVEIVPLFTIDETMEHNANPEILWQREDGDTLDSWKAGDGIRPYTALELAGRDIYIREGCYLCHSQMIRPFRDEKERYGHYSLASESMYDHPFQWGSKRTGPDLSRVGGKYSDDWHSQHLIAPRSLVPESVMPNYPWLAEDKVDADGIEDRMRAMQMMPGVGKVPYLDTDIDGATKKIQGKTEMDAMIAYLQVLGTMAKLDYNTSYRK